MNAKNRISGRIGCLVTAAALLLATVAPAAVTNYSTGFESAQGYTNGQLAGQQSWVSYLLATNGTFATNSGTNGNGVTALGLGGSAQAAYVGFSPLAAPYNKEIDLVRFLNLDPVGSNQPIITFSTKLNVIDSGNLLYDSFYFDFYNTDGLLLFGIEFNNENLTIYRVNSTNAFFSTGRFFTNSVEYPLLVTMNFLSNQYSAIFNGVTIVTNQPIAVAGLALNLGSVDAVWLPHITATPGDNWMMFDDWRIVSSPVTPDAPQLRVITPGGNGPATLRLTGLDGFQFAVDTTTNFVAWQAVGTNTVFNGIADYTDSSATGKTRRLYRARWVP